MHTGFGASLGRLRHSPWSRHLSSAIRHAGSEWKQPVCDQAEDAAAGTDAHGAGPDAESKLSGQLPGASPAPHTCCGKT